MSFHITVNYPESFDESTMTFIDGEQVILEMEHSLFSISKWEEKWHKSYIENSTNKTLTNEETFDYIRCMIVNDEDVDLDVLNYLSFANLEEIQNQIDNKATATWFSERENHIGMSHQTVTSELLYGQMAVLGIPFDEPQHWHLNRLMALIRVCSNLNTPPKKMSKKESARYQSNLIEKRRQEERIKREQAEKEGSLA